MPLAWSRVAIGEIEQFVHAGRPGWARRRADGQRQLEPIFGERPRHRIRHSACHPERRALIGAGSDNNELIPTQAPERAAGTQRSGTTCATRLKRGISRAPIARGHHPAIEREETVAWLALRRSRRGQSSQ